MTMVVNNFSKANQYLKEASEQSLNLLGLFLVGEAKRRTPVDTGYLRGMMKHRIINELSGKQLQLINNAEYAIFVHEGTRFMPARRFITDAINQNQDRIVKLAQTTFKSKMG